MQPMANENRQGAFQRNLALEKLLEDLNDLLAPAEQRAVEQPVEQQFPQVFIVGCPRSGTTLVMQWLANSGHFAYPSNFLSRFYRAPVIGAKIQQMLTDPGYAFRDELEECRLSKIRYESDLGKTTGMLAPNEFWYFWRRFFRFGEIQQLTPEQLKTADIAGFKKELLALAAVFQKPLAMKAMNMNWHISLLAELLPASVFIYIRRHPLFNIQSLLEARRKYFGDINSWYSFRPPEFLQLQNRDPYYQVAGQVYYTNRVLGEALASLPASRKIIADYQDFCLSPARLWGGLAGKLENLGYHIDPAYTGPVKFTSTNYLRLEGPELEKINAAYREISGEDLSPTAKPADQFVGRGEVR